MVQVCNLLRRQHEEAYGARFAVDACCDDIKNYSSSKLRSMAEEPSRTITPEEEEEEEEKEEEGDPGTSSGDWLRLGLASPPSERAEGRQVLTELQLLRDRPSSSSSSVVPVVGLAPPQMPWGSWKPGEMIGADVSSVPMLAIPEFTTAQFARPLGSPGASAEGGFGIRVVSPPRRQTGIWLILQAAPNQGRQPFLPQIPRSYLRIKDEGLTISLLMKYLVKKLGLEDESEVEITCRDQQLLPFLTLQYVRDNIWCLRDMMSMLVDPPSIDHVMTLQYRRGRDRYRSMSAPLFL
ncbi:protein LAX PANICLE 2-like [Musa acuminata AAA Group]|uniref:protein LAX PANICLE 2-like n=1 Tax=Musa acuminata AAA Group TaxID=214697 RepID=UPI0031DF7E53